MPPLAPLPKDTRPTPWTPEEIERIRETADRLARRAGMTYSLNDAKIAQMTLRHDFAPFPTPAIAEELFARAGERFLTDGRPYPAQDPKYAFHGGWVFKRDGGQVIPPDEPVFVFRAADNRAVSALSFYAGWVKDPEHSAAVLKRVKDFDAFAQRQPQRMKDADT